MPPLPPGKDNSVSTRRVNAKTFQTCTKTPRLVHQPPASGGAIECPSGVFPTQRRHTKDDVQLGGLFKKLLALESEGRGPLHMAPQSENRPQSNCHSTSPSFYPNPTLSPSPSSPRRLRARTPTPRHLVLVRHLALSTLTGPLNPRDPEMEPEQRPRATAREIITLWVSRW